VTEAPHNLAFALSARQEERDGVGGQSKGAAVTPGPTSDTDIRRTGRSPTAIHSFWRRCGLKPSSRHQAAAVRRVSSRSHQLPAEGPDGLDPQPGPPRLRIRRATPVAYVGIDPWAPPGRGPDVTDKNAAGSGQLPALGRFLRQRRIGSGARSAAKDRREQSQVTVARTAAPLRRRSPLPLAP
jgi:hypothetical protein